MIINELKLAWIQIDSHTYNDNLAMIKVVSIIDIILNVILQMWIIIKFLLLFNFFLSSENEGQEKQQG